MARHDAQQCSWPWLASRGSLLVLCFARPQHRWRHHGADGRCATLALLCSRALVLLCSRALVLSCSRALVLSCSRALVGQINSPVRGLRELSGLSVSLSVSLSLPLSLSLSLALSLSSSPGPRQLPCQKLARDPHDSRCDRVLVHYALVPGATCEKFARDPRDSRCDRVLVYCSLVPGATCEKLARDPHDSRCDSVPGLLVPGAGSSRAQQRRRTCQVVEATVP